jgi:hypothetical protein
MAKYWTFQVPQLVYSFNASPQPNMPMQEQAPLLRLLICTYADKVQMLQPPGFLTLAAARIGTTGNLLALECTEAKSYSLAEHQSRGHEGLCQGAAEGCQRRVVDGTDKALCTKGPPSQSWPHLLADCRQTVVVLWNTWVLRC